MQSHIVSCFESCAHRQRTAPGPGTRQTFDLGTIAPESRWPDDVRSSVHGHGRRGGEQLQLRLQRHSADHSLLMPMDVHALSREQLRRSGELESLEGGGGGGVGGDRWGSSSPGGSLVSGGKSGGALLRALSLPGDEWHADPQKRSPRVRPHGYTEGGYFSIANCATAFTTNTNPIPLLSPPPPP